MQARRGEGKGIYSNNYQMTYRPVTAASLVLPAGSRVVYARLYWGGTYGMDSPNGPGPLTDQQINRISSRPPATRPTGPSPPMPPSAV